MIFPLIQDRNTIPNPSDMEHPKVRPKVFIAIPCLLHGGTENQTLNLAHVLVSAGYQVTICCYYEYDADMVRRFEGIGAEVLLVKYERADGFWHLAKGLIHLFKGKKPDVVHVQYMAPGFAPIVAAKLSGVRAIFATVHQPGRTHGFNAKILLRSAAFLCTVFFCVSQAAEESWFGNSAIFDPEIGAKPRRKHYTIYNAVDVSHIAEGTKSIDRLALKKSLALDECPIIGVVGRLRKEKGQDVLIGAMPTVILSFPNACLLIVGDGPDREQLQKMADDLGLQNHILWTGQKEPESVMSYLAIMDVAVVPSRFEGFGLTAAEAMAAGLPVVATDVDGLSEVVEDEKTGYLVPPVDSALLAQRIIDLLLDPVKARRMGQAGKESVRQHFSMERFKKIILGAYRQFA